jgi:hypothetical protein
MPKVNPIYIPSTLTKKDRKKQINSIKKRTNRPKLNSYISKRSKFAKLYEKKYNQKITNKNYITKNFLSKKGIELILNKGKAAYYTSGSRPNQTKESWAYGRLASVILFGPAFYIDQNIAVKYGKQSWIKSKRSKKIKKIKKD